MDNINVLETKKLIPEETDPKRERPNPIFEANIDNQTYLFYDNNIKKIFVAKYNKIKIYNKHLTKLHTSINVNFDANRIISLTANKDLNYILCHISMGKEKTALNKFVKKLDQLSTLLLMNIEKLKICGFLPEKYDCLLGMFFIGKKDISTNLIQKENIIKRSKTLNINDVQNLNDFCLIFVNKIIFNEIVINNYDKTEVIKNIYEIKISNNYIKNYLYNYKHKILSIIKIDNTIEFYNLSNRKFYHQKFNVTLPLVTIKKDKSTFKNILKKKGDEEKIEIKSEFLSEKKYTQSQFYLETIYNDLYFICLSYEDNMIYIFEIESLDSFKLKVKVDYDNHENFSCLQVIDNLILVHNFKLNSIIVIDIQSKKIIIYIKNNFTLDSNINNYLINGELLSVKNNNIIDLYNIKFNCIEYEKLINETMKEIKKNKVKENKTTRNEMVKYYMLVNILNRKNSKSLIIDIIRRMILNNEKSFVIARLLFKIISDIKDKMPSNTDKTKATVILKKDSKDLVDANSAIRISKFYDNLSIQNKYNIKQSDIFFSLFKNFELDLDNIKLNSTPQDDIDKLLIRIIYYMTVFINRILAKKIGLQICYSLIITQFIKKVKNTEKLIPLFCDGNIVDNVETAIYLLELGANPKEKNNLLFEQYGINMLMRLNKYDKILEYFLKNKPIYKILMLIKEYSQYLSKDELSGILSNNKENIIKNKNFLNKIYKSNIIDNNEE